MSRPALRPYLLGYQSWSDYVREWVRIQLLSDPQAGLRALAARAGIGVASLRRAMDDDRPISPAEAERLARAMGLEGPDAGFFADLCALANAAAPGDAERAAARIAARREAEGVLAIDGDFYELLGDPRMLAIYELASHVDFREDPAWIAATLDPPMEADAAGALLARLLAMGALVRQPDGRLRPRAEIAVTGGLLRVMAEFRLAEGLIAGAEAALDAGRALELRLARPRVRAEDLPALLALTREIHQAQVADLVEPAPPAQAGARPARVLAVAVSATPESPPLPPLLAGVAHAPRPAPARPARVRRARGAPPG